MVLEEGYLDDEERTAVPCACVQQPKPIEVDSRELRRHEHGSVIFKGDQATVEKSIDVRREGQAICAIESFACG